MLNIKIGGAMGPSDRWLARAKKIFQACGQRTRLAKSKGKTELADLCRPVRLRSSVPIRKQSGDTLASMEFFSIKIFQGRKIETLAKNIKSFAGPLPEKNVHQTEEETFHPARRSREPSKTTAVTVGQRAIGSTSSSARSTTRAPPRRARSPSSRRRARTWRNSGGSSKPHRLRHRRLNRRHRRQRWRTPHSI